MADSALVERTFEVELPVERAWDLLADVERWPEWAPHVRTARLDGRLGPATEGRFTFRPFGSGRFRVTDWQPGTTWTWRGSALGLTIDYHHRFRSVTPEASRLTWTVEVPGGRRGIRARTFTRIYTRNIDRAWPSFAAWAKTAP